MKKGGLDFSQLAITLYNEENILLKDFSKEKEYKSIYMNVKYAVNIYMYTFFYLGQRNDIARHMVHSRPVAFN